MGSLFDRPALKENGVPGVGGPIRRIRRRRQQSRHILANTQSGLRTAAGTIQLADLAQRKSGPPRDVCRLLSRMIQFVCRANEHLKRCTGAESLHHEPSFGRRVGPHCRQKGTRPKSQETTSRQELEPTWIIRHWLKHLGQPEPKYGAPLSLSSLPLLHPFPVAINRSRPRTS